MNAGWTRVGRGSVSARCRVGVIVTAVGLRFYFVLEYPRLLSWFYYARYYLPFAIGA